MTQIAPDIIAAAQAAHSRWDHAMRFLIRQTIVPLIPYRFPMATRYPSASLISRTWSSVSLWGASTPFIGFRFQRSLRCISRLLSPSVPHHRWLGLTQPGVSQVWQQCRSPGRGFPAIAIDTCVAKPTLDRPTPITPYPFWLIAPAHRQQSSGACGSATLAQKREGSVDGTVRSLILKAMQSFGQIQLSGQAV